MGLELYLILPLFIFLIIFIVMQIKNEIKKANKADADSDPSLQERSGMRTILGRLNKGRFIYEESQSDKYCFLVKAKEDGKLYWYDELERKFEPIIFK